MVIADGLFAFLSEGVIVGVFRRVTKHFRSGELAYNDCGPIGSRQDCLEEVGTTTPDGC